MSANYYGHEFGRPRVGTETTGMMHFDEILRADGGPPSATLQDRGVYRPRVVRIGYSRYTDPAQIQREIDGIWNKCWTVAAREEDIPNVGDMTRYDLVDTSYVIVRTAADTIKAFHNTCRHRGRLLCDGRMHADKFQCRFHGWTYNLDGSLAWVPSRQDFPNVKNEKYGLLEVRVERWGGNVFINPDPKSRPLSAALGVLAEHFKESPLEDRYTALLMRKKIRANWKLTQEAFMEAYHMVETHWDALPFSGDANTLYDCWSADNNDYCISRVLTPLGVPSPYLQDSVSAEQALQVFLRSMGFSGEAPTGEDIGKLRAFAADVRKQELSRMFGRSYAHLPASQLIDAVKYFMFPNFHPWWGEGVPLWYRFLPNGRNPGECIMEVRLLLPVPASGPRPPAAAPIEVDFEQRCSEIPELAFLGHIFDQDMGNIPFVQAGIKAAPRAFAAPTLARSQEASITHFHEIYGRRLAAG